MARKNRLAARINSPSTGEPPAPAKQKKTKKRSRYSLEKGLPVEETAPAPDYGNIHAEVFMEDQNTHLETVRQKKRWTRYIPLTLVLSLSIYLCFLIFGVIYTPFAYDENNRVAPVVYSIQDLREQNEYQKIASYYIRIQNLYASTLELDADLVKNPQNSLVISFSYSELLQTVDKIVVDLNAAEFDAKYSSIYKQMKYWTSTDIALYLQYISSAIANNDQTAQANALVARRTTFSDFAIITSNIETVSKSIPGVENVVSFDWDPDEFYTTLVLGGG